MSRVLPFCFTSPFTRVVTANIGGVEICNDPGTHRTESVEPFATRELNVLTLEIPCCYIVDACVTKHVAQGVICFG
jgi:hypothetical protein